MKFYENHVYNSEDFDTMVKSYLKNGFTVNSYRNNILFMVKNDYGNLLIHILLLMTTTWFSLGVLNLFYLILSYYLKTERVSITFISKRRSHDFHNNNNFHKVKYNDISYITAFLDKPVIESTHVMTSKNSNQSSIIDYLEK